MLDWLDAHAEILPPLAGLIGCIAMLAATLGGFA